MVGRWGCSGRCFMWVCIVELKVWLWKKLWVCSVNVVGNCLCGGFGVGIVDE